MKKRTFLKNLALSLAAAMICLKPQEEDEFTVIDLLNPAPMGFHVTVSWSENDGVTETYWVDAPQWEVLR